MVAIKSIGNVKVGYDNNGKKSIQFPAGSSWKNPKKSGDNGHFIVPDNDIIVFDIDDLEIEHNKYIINKFLDVCTYVVKTPKKGYHLYFNYCPELSQIKKLPSLDIIHSQSKMLLCPPTKIFDPVLDDFREYKFIKSGDLVNVPGELINYILTTKNKLETNKTELLIESDKITKRLAAKQEDKKLQKEFKELKTDNDIITAVLENLNRSRADDYNDWFRVLMILKNEGIEYQIFEEFSKRSSKYDSNVQDIWNRYKPNDAKNKLSMSSLWYMLKQDNPSAFNKIKCAEVFKGYIFDNYKPTGDYSSVKFLELFEADKTFIGSKMIDCDILSLTNSFKYFNAHHCKVTGVGCYFRIDYEGNLKKISKLPNNFKEQLNNAFIISGDKKTTFLNLYDENSYQYICDKIDFNPTTNDKTVLNYFNGFKYINDSDPINLELIKPYIDFVAYVFNNQKQTEHFFDWLAHIIQKPGEKQTQCYVLYSFTHGIGKNTIVTAITNIFKGYYYKLKDAEQMADKFNSEALGKLFCYGDEIKTFKNGESLSNIVKNLISQTECPIELKGKDKIMVNDYCNYLFTTNNENNFQIEATDRRFNMVECNTKKLDAESYVKINNLIKTDDFGLNFFKFLSRRNIENYDPFMALKSEYKERMETNSLPADLKTFYTIASNLNESLYVSDIYNRIILNMNGKKPRSQKVIFETLKEVYGFKLIRGYDAEGKRETKYSIPFDNSKNGIHNNEMLKKLAPKDELEFSDDEEEEN